MSKAQRGSIYWFYITEVNSISISILLNTGNSWAISYLLLLVNELAGIFVYDAASHRISFFFFNYFEVKLSIVDI